MNSIVREILCDIITQHGRVVYEDPQRLRAILKDRCPGNQKEVHVLAVAAEQRVPQDLLSRSAGLPAQAAAARLVQRLTHDVAMDAAAAQWGLESWMLALGLVGAGELTKGSADHTPDAVHNPPPTQAGRRQPVRTRRASRTFWIGMLVLLALACLGGWQAAEYWDWQRLERLLMGRQSKAAIPPTPPRPEEELLQAAQRYFPTGEPAESSESKRNRELAKQLYNTLMRDIEPDLVFDSIPKLKEKFDKDTVEQQAERMKRYMSAFLAFEARLGEIQRKMNDRVHQENVAKLRSYVDRAGWNSLSTSTVVEGAELRKWVDKVRSERKQNGLKEHPWLESELEKIPGWRW